MILHDDLCDPHYWLLSGFDDNISLVQLHCLKMFISIYHLALPNSMAPLSLPVLLTLELWHLEGSNLWSLNDRKAFRLRHLGAPINPFLTRLTMGLREKASAIADFKWVNCSYAQMFIPLTYWKCVYSFTCRPTAGAVVPAMVVRAALHALPEPDDFSFHPLHHSTLLHPSHRPARHQRCAQAPLRYKTRPHHPHPAAVAPPTSHPQPAHLSSF